MKLNLSQDKFTLGEEIANAVLHGVAGLFAIAGLVFLVLEGVQSKNLTFFYSYLIFGVGLLILYIFSTLLHSLPTGKAKNLFEIFDHSAIYVLIAGTYTPFLLISLANKTGWTLFWIVWAMAFGGILFKVFFVKRFIFVSTLLYIVMGWLIVFAWSDLISVLNQKSLVLLIIGGVLYTIGAVFYMIRLFKFHHFIWHWFVFIASICHFFAVILIK